MSNKGAFLSLLARWLECHHSSSVELKQNISKGRAERRKWREANEWMEEEGRGREREGEEMEVKLPILSSLSFCTNLHRAPRTAVCPEASSNSFRSLFP